jgi:hypothetical protein
MLSTYIHIYSKCIAKKTNKELCILIKVLKNEPKGRQRDKRREGVDKEKKMQKTETPQKKEK